MGQPARRCAWRAQAGACALILAAAVAGCARTDAEPAPAADPASAVADAPADTLVDVVAASQQGAGSEAVEPPARTQLIEEDEVDPLDIPGEIIPEYGLELGDCFNQVQGRTAGRLFEITARVDCDQPHWAEVFHILELDVSHPAIYPGDTEMRDYARRRCYEHFETFVDETYELSAYEIEVFTPTRANFEHEVARYRRVHCWLHETDGANITGTARGTKR